ncbi:hypothetical protein ISN45_At02g026650 [Arabidopsis thaliana x Arabidopsis arenosa]|uniref:Uncharacterized protein n=3 Tax=Arabidopsis TaxID=3701 RepID=A0A8T2G7H0_ARASU|nr:hypothetical protein ISN45_At02g026650 [Arabidopsis thaliana x Arabidopsis arenosa]KAG7642820.1 hypothetical protein ISN44_As02g026930 [Arabidopsis suecica]CAD5320130.1 unnamed protein product [Arabidopsis thaliana]
MIFSIFSHCYRSNAVDREESSTIDQRLLAPQSGRRTSEDSTRWQPSLYPISEDVGESDRSTAKVSVVRGKSKTKKLVLFSYKIKRAWNIAMSTNLRASPGLSPCPVMCRTV